MINLVQIIARFGRTGPDGRRFLLGPSTRMLAVSGYRYSESDRSLARSYQLAIEAGEIEENVILGHNSRYTLKENL